MSEPTSSGKPNLRRPFAIWVISGALLYVGIAVFALLLEGSATGGAPLTDPFILAYLIIAVLFILAGISSLTGKRWALIFSTVLTLAFLGLTIPFTTGTLVNPADASFWILFSAIAFLVLALIFGVAALVSGKTGLGSKRYLASPNSWGGLLALAVVGFVAGGVMVSVMTGSIVAGVLRDFGQPADIVVIPGASFQNTAEPYTPGALIVTVGETVTWFNSDTVVHTVTSDTGLFDSGNLLPGERYSVTFTEAGTYSYFCIPHPWMTGTVVVQ